MYNYYNNYKHLNKATVHLHLQNGLSLHTASLVKQSPNPFRFISRLFFYCISYYLICCIGPLVSKILTLNSPSDRVWTVIVNRSVTSRSNFVNQSLHMSSPICSRSLGATALWISPKSRGRRALSHVNPALSYRYWLVRYMGTKASVPANTSRPTSATSDSIVERRNEWKEIDKGRNERTDW